VIQHVYPVNDLREHVTDGGTCECWCRPEVEEVEGNALVIHNSMDQRERYEPGGDLKPQ
jgi:hypothetical protein